MLIRFVISELKVILASSICAHLCVCVCGCEHVCVCRGVLFVTSVCVLIQYRQSPPHYKECM